MLGTEVLGTKDVTATIAVKNIEVAKRFYGGKLGLAPTESREPSVAGYKSGPSVVLLYESQFAGTNQATAATWMVGDDVDGIVQALKTSGIVFEHYDMPNTKLEGDVHVSGKMRVAWFKDPDGNILCLVNG